MSVALADITGDGIPELITASGLPGQGGVEVVAEFRVTDTTTGRILRLQPLGAYVLGQLYVAAGDLTGDGNPEVVVGPGRGLAPKVLVYDLKGFADPRSLGPQAVLIDTILAYDPGFVGGVRVAVGAVTEAGVNEIITVDGTGGGPHVRAFRLGKNSPREVNFFWTDAGNWDGAFVAAGDIDGNGLEEIIIGSKRINRVLAFDLPSIRQAIAAGQIPLALRNFGSNPTLPFVGSTVDAGDFNGDGIDEIVTGSYRGSLSTVRIFDVSSAPRQLNAFLTYEAAFSKGVLVAVE